MKRKALSIGLSGLLALAPLSAAAAAEYKIAVVMATTGGSAFVGVPAVNAMKLAEDDLREQGFFGDNTFTVTYEDNRSDKQEAITLLNRVAGDASYQLFIGPISTSEALAAAPAAVDLKMPMFTTGTSPDILKAGDWVFKSAENADDFIRPLGEYIGNTVKPKSCYLVSIRDNEAYILYSRIFKEAVTAAGTTIAAEDTILSTDSDFTALATKIVNSGADCIYVSTYPEVGANLVVQARQAGLPAETVIVGNQNMASDRYINTGGSAVEGTYLLAEFSPHAESDLTRDFIAKYTERFGIAPDSWSAVGYSMMVIAAHALKNAGENPTREAVRDALAASKGVPVVIGSGKWSLDENRIPHFGAVVLQIKDGKAVFPN